jgi:tagatose 1,6-diphosphate aldolase
MTTEIFKNHQAFLMLALDHRNSLHHMLNAKKPEEVSQAAIVNFKKEVIESLANQFSGILLDPTFGLKAYQQVSKGVEKPYLLSIEKSGYQNNKTGPQTELAFTGEELKKLGASGIKLLLPIDIPKPSLAHQLKIAKKAFQESQKVNLPLFLEIIIPLKVKKESILDILKIFLKENIHPAVFKLEYPGNAFACRKIKRIIDPIPWILLTRGKKFKTFRSELEEAIKQGAAGFLAGRALWQEGVNLKGVRRQEFFSKTLPRRFDVLSQIVLKQI